MPIPTLIRNFLILHTRFTSQLQLKTDSQFLTAIISEEFV
jgi:hypothetical protein